jgi:transcription elongation factor SPT6
VVNEVGVDINLAADKPAFHAHPMQFVGGLGPRKAIELIQIVRTKGCVHYREQMLEDHDVRTVMRRCVWTNAAAFLRITKNSSMWDEGLDVGQVPDANDEPVMAGGGPLERTRIHPESYRLAKQIAMDALEEEDSENTLKRAMHPQHRYVFVF